MDKDNVVYVPREANSVMENEIMSAAQTDSAGSQYTKQNGPASEEQSPVFPIA